MKIWGGGASSWTVGESCGSLCPLYRCRGGSTWNPEGDMQKSAVKSGETKTSLLLQNLFITGKNPYNFLSSLCWLLIQNNVLRHLGASFSESEPLRSLLTLSWSCPWAQAQVPQLLQGSFAADCHQVSFWWWYFNSRYFQHDVCEFVPFD